MSEMKLVPLPCPFCGGRAEITEGKWSGKTYYGVECAEDCGVWMDAREPTEDGATSAWNGRADAPVVSGGGLSGSNRKGDLPTEGHDTAVMAHREPVTHDLKTWPVAFAAVSAGLKPWEYRKADRDYRAGDFLLLREWSQESGYTGQQLVREVVWMLPGGMFGIPADHCIMSIPATVHQAVVGELVEALEKIANPPYPLGFNRLRGIARAALAKYATQEGDGWIEWAGGENPVPGKMVEWRNAAGTQARCLSDDVAGFGKPLGQNSPIIAYRVVTQQSGKAEQ